MFTRTQAAEWLKLGLSTLATETARGRIGSVRIGDRRLYRLSDLVKYVEAHATEEAAG